MQFILFDSVFLGCHDQLCWSSIALGGFRPLLAILLEQVLGNIMADLHIGLQQIGVVDVAIQVELSCFYFVKLLNAVIKLCNVRELELLLVD